MSSYPNDDYGYQPELNHKQAAFAFIAILLFFGCGLALTYYFDLGPKGRATLGAANAVLCLLALIMQAKRIFDPTVKRVNEDRRYEDTRNLTAERVVSLLLVGLFLFIAVVQISDVISIRAYTAPLFFVAPSTLLIFVGMAFQNETKHQADFDWEWDIKDRVSHPTIWHRLGTALIVGGVIIAAIGGFNLFMSKGGLS